MATSAMVQKDKMRIIPAQKKKFYENSVTCISLIGEFRISIYIRHFRTE